DAIPSNPIRDVSRFSSGKRSGRVRPKVVLDAEELPGLRAHLRASKRARAHDLVDFVDMLAACGCRIGELLALTWANVDLDAGTISIEGTVIREPGAGLFVQQHTKSMAGMRTIRLPDWAVAILRRRSAAAMAEWVFPSTVGTLRDPDNTR